jgi:hypothetical protein
MLRKVLSNLAAAMLLASCQDATTLRSGRISEIQIGTTTREQLVKILGPAQHNNRADATWIEEYIIHSWLPLEADDKSNNKRQRILYVHFSATNVVKSCDVYTRYSGATDLKHYKCSDF